MTCGIYKITENETGRCYIGQSKNVENRWKQHRRRFPTDLFSYEILMSCDADCLDFFERAFIDGYDSHRNGFNGTLGGTGFKIRFPSEETKAKMSKPRNWTPESLAKCSNKGKKLSEEHKAKISESLRNTETKPGFKKGNVPVNKGVPMSDEQKQKLKDAWKLRKARRLL